jgi:hypothetical protein
MVGIGRGSARDADVLHQLVLAVIVGHAARSAISFLVSAITWAGFNPFGQTFAQFMMVWQR